MEMEIAIIRLNNIKYSAKSSLSVSELANNSITIKLTLKRT
jgi:hypothetical protein